MIKAGMNERVGIVITPELLARIDERRGSLSREEYTERCVEAFLSRRPAAVNAGGEKYATVQEFDEFQRKVERLERTFLEFLVNHGLELGR